MHGILSVLGHRCCGGGHFWYFLPPVQASSQLSVIWIQGHSVRLSIPADWSQPESIHALRDTCEALTVSITPGKPGGKIWAACAENTEKGLLLKLAHEGRILARRKLGGVGSGLACDCMNKSTDTERRACHITASVPSCKHFSVHIGEGAGGTPGGSEVWHH